jgi:hypothetical protein
MVGGPTMVFAPHDMTKVSDSVWTLPDMPLHLSDVILVLNDGDVIA